ncbi:phosphatase PAP2 family protein [Nocardia tengchongensis]|uniref:phosphatase PAP2 family protein n=1 Tax=Nocardia tengchongensis TaxID=2055889 RepID=UPI0036D150F1
MASTQETHSRWLGLTALRAAVVITAAGSAAVCALAVLFAKILDNVLDGDGVTVWDRPVSSWLAAHREPGLTSVLRALTEVGNPPVLAAVMAAVAMVTAARTRTLLPITLGAAAYGGYLLMVVTVKLAVGRPRPPLPERVVAIDGSSFPSGHAAGIAVVALVSAWMVTLASGWQRWIGVTAWATAVPLVVAVGFSRVYLGVHYPSDIVAGWALGAAWGGVLILAGSTVTPLRRGHPLGRRRCRP